MPTPQRLNNSTGNQSSEILRASGCRVDFITDIMDWRSSGRLDDERWLALIHDFAKLGPQPGPGEDYVWRTVMRREYGGLDRPHKYNLNLVDDEKAIIIRKIMRQEPIEPDALTETHREYIQNAIVKRDYK